MALTQLKCPSCDSIYFYIRSTKTVTTTYSSSSESTHVFAQTDTAEWQNYDDYEERDIEGRPGDWITLTWADNEVDEERNAELAREVNGGKKFLVYPEDTSLDWNTDWEDESEEYEDLHAECQECGETIADVYYNVREREYHDW